MQFASTIKPSVEFITGAADGSGKGQTVAGAQHVDQESYADILSSNRSAMKKARDLVLLSREQVSHVFSSVRPWREFFDRSSFAAPDGLSESISRLRRNVPHFYTNYIFLSLVCSSYILLINLWFSIMLLVTVLGYFYISSAVNDSIANGDATGNVYCFDRSWSATQMYTLLGVFGVVSFYFTDGSSVVFWLAFTTLGVTALHAVLRRPSLDAPQSYSYP